MVYQYPNQFTLKDCQMMIEAAQPSLAAATTLGIFAANTALTKSVALTSPTVICTGSLNMSEPGSETLIVN